MSDEVPSLEITRVQHCYFEDSTSDNRLRQNGAERAGSDYQDLSVDKRFETPSGRELVWMPVLRFQPLDGRVVRQHARPSIL